MNNIKWGFTTAAAAVIISVGLGLLFGVGLFHIFTRALIFAAVFFGFGFGLRFLISSFLPELLFMQEESSAQESFDQPGSRINITLDNTGEYAVPELYKTPGDPDELGNIEDLVSGVFSPHSASDEPERPQSGIDRKKEESYNIESVIQSLSDQESFNFQDTDDFEKKQAEKPVFTASLGDDAGLGGLPDLDSMAMAFSTGGAAQAGGLGGSSAPAQTQEEFEPEQRRYAASKATPMKGDFNPKDLAKGISTVLAKDK